MKSNTQEFVCRCGDCGRNSRIFGVEFPCECNVNRFRKCPAVEGNWTRPTENLCPNGIEILTEEMINLDFGDVGVGRRCKDALEEANVIFRIYRASDRAKEFYFEMWDILRATLGDAEAGWQLAHYFYRANVRLDRLRSKDLSHHRAMILRKLLDGVETQETVVPEVLLKYNLGVRPPLPSCM